MADSIIQSTKECFICHDIRPGLEAHHCLHGAYRKKADKWGLWVWLCHYHHTGSSESAHHNHSMDLFFQKLAQEKFEELHGHDKFMEEFGRNWL